MLQKLKHIYETKYKLLLFIPIMMVLLALVQIGVQYSITGDFVHRGVSLKGGSTITITEVKGMDIQDLENRLKTEFPSADVTLRTITSAGKLTAVAIDSGLQESNEIAPLINFIRQTTGIGSRDYSVEIIGSSLGDAFFTQTIHALLVAFLLMGIVVFIYFRLLIPSLAVIAAAFSDIIVTLAIFNLTGIKLSTAGVAAFLMLIGYSVDTDMVLTTRVLRRTEGTVMDRVYSAIKTGSVMISSTLAAVFITLIFVQSDVIKQIMIILLIGLMVDYIMTWIQNVALLRLYLEWKNKRKKV
ncbi:MAG: protein translocase subunit SecF [Nanoarchaeota archaeon]